MAKKKPVRLGLGAYTEEEALDSAKNWFKENGTSIVLGIVISIGGIGGWYFWQDSQQKHINDAATLYLDYINDQQKYADNVDSLTNEYLDTPYPALIRLQHVREQVENKKLDEATKDLQWVIDNAQEEAIATLAQVRLFRIMLAQKKYKKVINDINAYEYAESALGIVEELRGDALVGLGKKQDAIKAYREAIQAQQKSTNPFLEMKLYSIGG